MSEADFLPVVGLIEGAWCAVIFCVCANRMRRLHYRREPRGFVLLQALCGVWAMLQWLSVLHAEATQLAYSVAADVVALAIISTYLYRSSDRVHLYLQARAAPPDCPVVQGAECPIQHGDVPDTRIVPTHKGRL